MAPKNKKQPSVWPKLPFIGFRFVQFISAVLVLGITGYFNYNLVKDKYPIPWEFIAVDIAAALTIFNTIGSSFLICCGALSPLLVMIIDGILSLFWALVFGTLSRAMGKTTFETCNAANWGNSDGIIICHLYKSLFAFTALGWLLHLGSFSFASVIRRRTKRHAYAPAPNPANLHTQKTSYNPTHSSTGSRSSEYGASAPPVYASAPNYTAGKDETYA